MPNTLAHLGVQALVGRAVLPSIPMGWVWLGCILPDMPWIGQRAVQMLATDVSAFDLRLWAIGQSSLFFCLVGAAGFACLSRRLVPVCGTLALGCFLHLLMDAIQTKWGNGVILAAPWNWSMVNAGLYWPEDWPTLALTALGGVGVLVGGAVLARERSFGRGTTASRSGRAASGSVDDRAVGRDRGD